MQNVGRHLHLGNHIPEDEIGGPVVSRWIVLGYENVWSDAWKRCDEAHPLGPSGTSRYTLSTNHGRPGLESYMYRL